MTNNEIVSLSAVHLPFFSKTNQDCIVAFAEAIHKTALLEAADECEAKHVNGNWKFDTRHECAEAIRSMAD